MKGSTGFFIGVIAVLLIALAVQNSNGCSSKSTGTVDTVYVKKKITIQQQPINYDLIVTKLMDSLSLLNPVTVNNNNTYSSNIVSVDTTHDTICIDTTKESIIQYEDSLITGTIKIVSKGLSRYSFEYKIKPLNVSVPIVTKTRRYRYGIYAETSILGNGNGKSLAVMGGLLIRTGNMIFGYQRGLNKENLITAGYGFNFGK